MKRRVLTWFLVLAVAISLAGCVGDGNAAGNTADAGRETGGAAGTEPETNTTAGTGQETENAAGAGQETDKAETAVQPGQAGDDTEVRVGSLKGPTSMGLVYLMEEAAQGSTSQLYSFTMATAADEINAAFLKGELDIVLIPANVASVLYNKTEGQVAVIDVNTLGVLYVLESGDTVRSAADMAGKTVYLPGKGTTPDYALQYVLAQNGLGTEDVDLQYKSEAAEVISALAENPESLGLLPQPAVTTACMKNENLRIALDLTQEWDRVCEEGSLVTGVTVVRRAFLEEHEAAVKQFLVDHAASAEYVNANTEQAAEWIAAKEIVPKAAIAVKAIPYCNITCVTGADMQAALSGYLSVLAGQNAEAIGGELPGDDFYYIP